MLIGWPGGLQERPQDLLLDSRRPGTRYWSHFYTGLFICFPVYFFFTDVENHKNGGKCGEFSQIQFPDSFLVERIRPDSRPDFFFRLESTDNPTSICQVFIDWEKYGWIFSQIVRKWLRIWIWRPKKILHFFHDKEEVQYLEIAHLYLYFFKLRAALNPVLQFDISTAKLKASIPTKIRTYLPLFYYQTWWWTEYT